MQLSHGGILPKEETQSLALLREGYDGRGVLVGVLDTGVDVQAPGMAVTTTGERKMTYAYDCSGAGDVHMTAREVDGAKVVLDSSTVLSLPKGWGGTVMCGSRPAFDLFPALLVKRIKEERKKEWTAALSLLLEESHTLRAKEEGMEASRKEELDARIEHLQTCLDKFDDIGPLLDVVLFSIKGEWRLCIVDENSPKTIDGIVDGSAVTLLRPFNSKSEEDVADCAHFSQSDSMTFSYNVYEEGSIVELVTTCGAHGTHVAGIIGANLDNEAENGCAPGCTIASLTIGDARLGSMETGTAMTRAMWTAAKIKCDLVNMSYGEASCRSDGRIFEAVQQLVDQGCIFVSSAGNEGPALSTVGAPGSLSGYAGAIGIGALVTPAMMEAEYGMRVSVPANQYTWSSRGPAFDGYPGVNLSAPGGAIAPVPNWTRQKNQLMNGTSMSSPNACGAIAQLLSALKQGRIPYSPQSVRRALEATAAPVQGVDTLAIGRGLIQVQSALEYIVEHQSDPYRDVSYEIRIPSHSMKGVYLREPKDTLSSNPIDLSVQIEPRFHESVPNAQRCAFTKEIHLVSSSPHVSHSSCLVLMHGGKSFDLRIDVPKLEPGVFFTEVLGYDGPPNQDRHPLFRVPITIMKPVDSLEPTYKQSGIAFYPGMIQRTVLVVPEGAHLAKITVRGVTMDGPRQFIVHGVYNQLDVAHRDAGHRRFLSLEENNQEETAIHVVPGRTLEVAVAQFWKSLGDSVIDLRIDFYGPRVVQGDTIHLDVSQTVARFDLESLLRRESLSFNAELTHVDHLVSPSSAVISVCSKDRGDWAPTPQGPQSVYRLVLEYAWTLSEKADVRFMAPDLCSQLYESPFESQFWMCFDANKRKVAQGDAWPKDCKLKAGVYTVRFMVRHASTSRLDSLKTMRLTIRQKLASALPMSVHASHKDALSNVSPVTKKTLSRHTSRPFFLRAPEESTWAKSVPKKSNCPLRFIGRVKLHTLSCSGKDKRSLRVVMDSIQVASTSKEAPADEPFDLQEAYKNTMVKWMTSLEGDAFRKAYEAYSPRVFQAYPNCLELLDVYRKDAVGRKDTDAVIKTSEQIVQAIDQKALSMYFGTNADTDAEGYEKTKKLNQLRKRVLVDALVCLVQHGQHDKYAMLQQWADMDKNLDALYARVDYLCKKKRYGKAVQILTKALDDKANIKSLAKLTQERSNVYAKLGWKLLQENEAKLQRVRSPNTYALF